MSMFPTLLGAPVGLPRPRALRGDKFLPIPWNVQLDDEQRPKWSVTSQQRNAVWYHCQVCGLHVDGEAWALTDAFGKDPRGLIDHQLLHPDCARLAIRHCPHLKVPADEDPNWQLWIGTAGDIDTVGPFGNRRVGVEGPLLNQLPTRSTHEDSDHPC